LLARIQKKILSATIFNEASNEELSTITKASTIKPNPKTQNWLNSDKQETFLIKQTKEWPIS